VAGLFNNLGEDFYMAGAGMSLTTISLETNAPTQCISWHAVISNVGQGYQNVFVLSDLTVDCNWQGQTNVPSCMSCANSSGFRTSTNYICGYKLGAIALKTRYAAIHRVKVTNWGSNGMRPLTGEGMEAFGITITTVTKSDTLESLVPIIVEGCEVTGFTSVNGGYCTGIVVETRDRDYPDIQEALGTRTNLMAHIYNNYVHDISGIAMGCAVSEQVMFNTNNIQNCGAAFNCDTYSTAASNSYNNKIYFQDNTCEDLWGGLNIGNPYGGSNRFKTIYITNNRFRLKGDIHGLDWSQTSNPPPWCGWELSYAIRLHGGTDDVHLGGNWFSAVPQAQWLDRLGSANNDKWYLPIRYPNYPSGGYAVMIIYETNPYTVGCVGSSSPVNSTPSVDSANYYSTSSGSYSSMSTLPNLTTWVQVP
jgi:hypothetical protein